MIEKAFGKDIIEIKANSWLIEQHLLDTNAQKVVNIFLWIFKFQIFLSCHRCLINTGVEKKNNI